MKLNDGLKGLAVPIDKLKLDPKNARTHSKKNLDAIKASLEQFGQQKPIVALKDGMVIAGNGTLTAAKDLGWTEIAVVNFVDEKKARAYAIADNRSAELGKWDEDELAEALEDIGRDYNVGFSEMDIARLLGTKEPLEESDIQAPPKNPKTKVGDLWELGKHKLLCGDSSEVSSYERLLGNERATLVFTDPPYGVSLGKKNVMLNTFGEAGRCLTDIEGDDLPPKELKEMLVKVFKTAKDFMADDCSVFVCAPQRGGSGMMMLIMMTEAGLGVRHIVNWVKNCPTFSMGRLDYDYAHEPILFTWKKNHKRKKEGAFQSSVWSVDKPRANKLHPTMKPVELPMCAILNHTDDGDIVLDNFGGSGTTLIASEQTNRACRMIELTPNYCDVIIARWESLTSNKATLISRGTD